MRFFRVSQIGKIKYQNDTRGVHAAGFAAKIKLKNNFNDQDTKGTKEDKYEDFDLIIKDFLGALGVLVVKDS
jgi:hypothetical protein